MSTLILGGTGFIGRRLVPLLAQRGEEVVCMDLNPGTASYGQLGNQVRVVRGDVTQFDDVMAVTVAAKPSRVVNLAYFLGSEHAPHVATKLNIVGMDKCFEAARPCGGNPVVFASSPAGRGELPPRRATPLRRRSRGEGVFPPSFQPPPPGNAGMGAIIPPPAATGFENPQPPPAAKPPCPPPPPATRGELCPPVAGRGLCLH